MLKRDRRRRARGRRRPQGTPSVVFVDDCRWNAFHQLAPLLRRAGVRCIRVSTEGLAKTRVASWLLFDRYAIVRDPSNPEALSEILATENVIDIQFAESLGELVGGLAELLPADVAEQVRRRLAVVDKLTAARRFSEAGVRTPATVPIADSSPQEMVDRLGLPLVVKDRVGFGGERVSIARDLDTLVTAASGFGDGPGDLFYEQYVDGTKLNYAAVTSDAGIEQELAYKITQWKQPTGRAIEVEAIDDPQLVALGRKALGVAGCKGLVNIDVVRDHQGLDWLIDFNARAFGGSGSFRAAGIDISEGYLRAIGQRSVPPTRATPEVGVTIRVFPTCLEEVIRSHSITRTTVAFLRDSRPYLRWFGFRYWLSEAFITADSLRRGRKEQRAHRSSSAPQSVTGPAPSYTRAT